MLRDNKEIYQDSHHENDIDYGKTDLKIDLWTRYRTKDFNNLLDQLTIYLQI